MPCVADPLSHGSLFAWPNSKLAVMGAKQLVGVLETIKKDAANKYGEKLRRTDFKGCVNLFRHR